MIHDSILGKGQPDKETFQYHGARIGRSSSMAQESADRTEPAR